MSKNKIFKFVATGYSKDLTPIEILLPETTKFALHYYSLHFNDEYDPENTYDIWTIIKDKTGEIYKQLQNLTNNSYVRASVYYFKGEYILFGLDAVYVSKKYLTTIDDVNKKVKWKNYTFLWLNEQYQIVAASKIKRALGACMFDYQKVSVNFDYNSPKSNTYVTEMCSTILRNKPTDYSGIGIKDVKILNSQIASDIYDTLIAYTVNKQTGTNTLSLNSELFESIFDAEFVKNLLYKKDAQLIDDMNATITIDFNKYAHYKKIDNYYGTNLYTLMGDLGIVYSNKK